MNREARENGTRRAYVFPKVQWLFDPISIKKVLTKRKKSMDIRLDRVNIV